MTRSLRAQLLIGVTAVTGVALLVLGAAIDTAVRRSLLAEFDAALNAKAASVASMVEQHQGKVVFEFQSQLLPEFSSSQEPEYFEVWVKNKPFVHSASLRNRELDSTPLSAKSNILWTTLPDGRKGRAVGMKFVPYIDPGEPAGVNNPSLAASIVVARDTVMLDRVLGRLRIATVSLSVLAVFLTGAALVLLIQFATRPIRKLAQQIGSLDESDLSVQLDSSALPTEVAPLVDRLNGLLSRLCDAFTRERAFTADVAHELRTPLAGVLATLEVCRTRPRNSAEYETAIDKSIAQLTRLQSLAENLLLLARADAGQVKVATAACDVAALIEECWVPFEIPARERALSVSRQLPEPCSMIGDPHILRIVLTNLFDNAVSYADQHGQITIQILQSDHDMTIEVSNSASHFRSDDAAHVFDRFWRGDDSRSQTGRHAGLGLSLSQRLLSLTGDSITTDGGGGIFVARVMLRRGTGFQPVPAAHTSQATSRSGAFHAQPNRGDPPLQVEGNLSVR